MGARVSGENALRPAAQRVVAAAQAIGLDIQVHTMSQSTRTAEEAAAACGCAVAQIVKSLVFRGKDSGKLETIFGVGGNWHIWLAEWIAMLVVLNNGGESGQPFPPTTESMVNQRSAFRVPANGNGKRKRCFGW